MDFKVNFLLSTSWITKIPVLRNLWWGAFKTLHKQSSGKVKTSLHGYKALQPAGYSYAFTSRIYPTFNNPLIEIVYQTYRQKGRKLHVVDVGAAIGDTVFLLKANCPDMIETYYCIDGDREFYEYLTENLKRFDNVRCFNHVLSDSKDKVSSLVRIHSGTASAQGENKVDAMTFDELYETKKIPKIDVLKIDVDGFDGKVLGGAIQVLKSEKPSVVFEWHPKLYNKAETDITRPFEVLHSSGYNCFVWFTKDGRFSHFSMGFEPELLENYAEICLANPSDSDWHYDIVSFHPQSKMSVLDFFKSEFSLNKKSPF